MDVEIENVLTKKLILKPMEQPEDLENLNVGFTQKETWDVVYKTSENREMCCMMFL